MSNPKSAEMYKAGIVRRNAAVSERGPLSINLRTGASIETARKGAQKGTYKHFKRSAFLFLSVSGALKARTSVLNLARCTVAKRAFAEKNERRRKGTNGKEGTQWVAGEVRGGGSQT